ncbi:phosphotransferase family protein [Flavobacteriaceae bacterium PRS1]|nr:phosphotransferase family protein [Flavobacteriaceae bacterium PRS1]
MSSDNTRKVSKEEALHLDNLKRFLYEHHLINDIKSGIETRRFSGGFSNLTYLLLVENKEYVLRRPPFGAVKRGHDMSREYKVLSNLYASFSKIPKVYAFTDDESILGTPFYIMENANGIILDYSEANKRVINSSDFKIISNTWLDTFVALHQVDYKAAGLEDLGKPEGYAERQITNWAKQYEKAKTDAIPESQLVIKWLQNNQPKTHDNCLIHNDFKYDNVMFKDDSWTKINTVLDWEMCTLGDPLMDLGTSLSYWITEDDMDALKKGLPSPTVFKGNPNRTEIVELYSKKSGRTINNLVFYYVYGLFKLSVIVQQIYYRYRKGYTTDKRFEHLNKHTQLLFTIAWQAIQKNKIDKLF